MLAEHAGRAASLLQPAAAWPRFSVGTDVRVRAAAGDDAEDGLGSGTAAGCGAGRSTPLPERSGCEPEGEAASLPGSDTVSVPKMALQRWRVIADPDGDGAVPKFSNEMQ